MQRNFFKKLPDKSIKKLPAQCLLTPKKPGLTFDSFEADLELEIGRFLAVSTL